MNRTHPALAPCLCLALIAALAGCDRGAPAPAEGGDTSAAPSASSADAAPPAAAPVSADAEFEQLKATTPVDACAWLTQEKIKTVFPDLSFEIHQKLDPQMSGYVWDSRCTYWAGVGTIEFAKDTPTHTLDIFVGTSVSEEKAQSNLARRHETAVAATGYKAMPALGANAYATTNTGIASLFFVKGQSEVQINFSDLKTPNDQKIEKALALAQTL